MSSHENRTRTNYVTTIHPLKRHYGCGHSPVWLENLAAIEHEQEIFCATAAYTCRKCRFLAPIRKGLGYCTKHFRWLSNSSFSQKNCSCSCQKCRHASKKNDQSEINKKTDTRLRFFSNFAHTQYVWRY